MNAKLRVLWLSPIQATSPESRLSQNSGGWIEGWRWALETFCPEVELAILGQGSWIHKPFTYGNATYFLLGGDDDPSNKCDELAARWSHRSPMGDRARKSFERAVAAFRPDIIHVHGSESGLATLCADSDLPVILSLQGVANVLQGFMFSGQTLRDVVRDTASVHFLQGFGYAHRYLAMRNGAATERRILAVTRYLLGNTEWDRRVASILCPAAIYYHSDRAVRREFYGPRWSQPSSSGHPVVYCTSGQAPYKGLENLLQAAALLRDTALPNLEVRIAGADVRGANAAVLSRVIRQSHLDNTVRFLGVIDARQIVAELERAALFVLPSHIENESNALIEAMLVGTPCVAAGVGGVPSVLRDGVDGLLYHDRDPFALAGAMRQVLMDPRQSASLAASGRAAAHQRHDPASVARQLAAVYEDVVARAKEAN
jgi:Glycosyltransferase